MYVIAPIYIKFKQFRLNTHGRLEFSIECHKSINLKDLKMNVILSTESSNVDRFHILFDQEPQEKIFFEIDKLVEKNLAGIKGAKIYLFYKDNLIRTDWINSIEPSSEKELKKDILTFVQRMRQCVSDIDKILAEINDAILNNIIDIEDNVKDKSVWNDLGIYFIENGFYRQAEFVYRDMIQTINNYEKTTGKRLHKGLAFHNLGVVLLYQNRTEEAKEMFEHAYEEDKITYGVVKAESMQARETLRKFFNK
jgi:tetratricopeptide (TPR) repeat protein